MRRDENDPVAEALREIYQRHQTLTPDIVVTEARPEGHVLHPHFEWDDSLAAENYRRQQARQLIQSIQIAVTAAGGGAQTLFAPVYCRDPAKEQREQGYVLTESLAGHVALALQELEREVERAAYFLERARAVSIILGLEKQVGRVALRCRRELIKILEDAKQDAA